MAQKVLGESTPVKQVRNQLAILARKHLLLYEGYLLLHGIHLLETLEGATTPVDTFFAEQIAAADRRNNLNAPHNGGNAERISKTRIGSIVAQTYVARLAKQTPEFVGYSYNSLNNGVAQIIAKYDELELDRNFIVNSSPYFVLSGLATGEFVAKVTWNSVTNTNEITRLNGFELLTSSDWQDDIHKCAWVAVRKTYSLEQVKLMYQKEIETAIKSVLTPEGYNLSERFDWGNRSCFYSKGLDSLTTNPANTLSEVYYHKLENRVNLVGTGIISSMLSSGNADIAIDELVEVIEYWNRATGTYSVIVGDIEVISEKWDCRDAEGNDNGRPYPVVATKVRPDLITHRGLAPMETATPLIKLLDKVLDLMIKNAVLQNRVIEEYDASRIGETGYGPDGSITRLKLKDLPGDSEKLGLPQAVRFVSVPGNTYDFQALIRSLTTDVYAAVGLSQLAGGGSISNLSAREAALRNQGQEEQADYFLGKLEKDFFTSIARVMNWNIANYGACKLYNYTKESLNKSFLLITGVTEVKDGDKVYREFEFEGKKYKILYSSCDHNVILRAALGAVSKKDSKEIDAVIDGAILEPEVEEMTWSEFVSKVYIGSGKEVVAVITNLDFTKDLNIFVKGVTATTLSKQVQTDKLQTLLQLMVAAKQDVTPVLGELLKSYGISDIVHKLDDKTDLDKLFEALGIKQDIAPKFSVPIDDSLDFDILSNAQEQGALSGNAVLENSTQMPADISAPEQQQLPINQPVDAANANQMFNSTPLGGI